MPQRENDNDTQPVQATAQGHRLSGQEEQDLKAAEKGFDSAVSGLPEGKPLAPPTTGRDAEDRGQGARGHAQDEGDARGQSAVDQAEKKGLVPGGDTNAPPLDGQS